MTNGRAFWLRATAMVVLALVVVACSPPPEPREPPPPPQYDVLLWTFDPLGQTTSYWIRPWGEGAELVGQRDGVFFAGNGQLWQWTQRRVPVQVFPCESAGDGEVGEPAAENEAGVGSATELALMRVDQPIRQVLVEPRMPSEQARDYEHSVALLGSIGPYVFAVESTVADNCGPRAISVGSFHAWDLRGPRQVSPVTSLLSGAELAGIQANERVQAIDRISAEANGVRGFDVELAALIPRVGRDQANVQYLFLAPDCTECSDEGSQHTPSARIEARALPEQLQPFAPTPPVVRAFLRSNPELQVGGLSVVTDPARPALRSAFLAQPEAQAAPAR